jgi:hypothetical protein
MPTPYDLIHGGTPLAGVPEPPREVTFLPYVFPPPQAVPFDVVDVQTVNNGTTVVVPVIAGASAAYAVLRWFGNETAIAASILDINWTILIGGVGYQPYVTMLLSRGSIDNPDPILVRVMPNRAVDIAITNTGAAPLQVRTRLKGWYF